MLRTSSIFLFVFTFCFKITAAQTAQVLSQEDAPLTIYSFEAKYQEDGRYQSEGIRYDVEFRNDSDQSVVAYSIGFYSFDVFNRSLGRPLEGFSVESISPSAGEKGAWVQRVVSPGLFKEYGTALAYVARVRFENGTVWAYDGEAILEQLQEFEASLTLDDLSTRDR